MPHWGKKKVSTKYSNVNIKKLEKKNKTQIKPKLWRRKKIIKNGQKSIK